MASISSISGAQSAAQSGLQQLRLQQAKRNAEQAEQVANSLQAQARDAQQRASEAQENARSISAQSDQARTTAGQARQGLAALSTGSQMQSQLSQVVGQVVEKQKAAEPPPVAAAKSPAPPVTNTQGQVTGTVINTTA
jgi:chromosome segregation ATPase